MIFFLLSGFFWLDFTNDFSEVAAAVLEADGVA